MAKTERAIEMLRIINDNQGQYDAFDLVILVGVSERGIYRYLNSLKRARIEVKFDYKTGGYRLLNDPMHPDGKGE